MGKYIRLLIFFIALLGSGLAAYLFVLRGQNQAARSDVVLAIAASQEITSGDEVAFTVRYENQTKNPLRKAELFFRFPQGAVPTDRGEAILRTVAVGDLAPRAGGEHVFRARLVGVKGTILYANAELSYAVGGITAFRKTAQAPVRIRENAFLLNFNVPQRAVVGERIVYFLDYLNTSPNTYQKIRVRLSYPRDFAFGSADPQPAEAENVWDIGEVRPNESRRIAIYGILSGNENDAKRVKSEIGFQDGPTFFPLAESAFETVLVPPPLSVSIRFEGNDRGVVRLGDGLPFRITYKNTSNVIIKDGVIRAELIGELFDLRSIQPNLGYFDSIRNVVTWTQQNVRELAFLKPGESHELTFSVRLKDRFSIRSFNDRNFTVLIVATLESLNVPPDLALSKLAVSKKVELKIGTAAQFAAKGFYRETSARIENTGPIPPRVNQETTYTVHWQVSVPANDLENVEIRATLPTGVRPTGRVSASPTEIAPRFNEISGEVWWLLDRIPANSGVVLPVYEAVFQVAATPSATKIGQSLELVRPSLLTARDAFTGEAIEIRTSAIHTTLGDDPSIGSNGGLVVP